MAIRILPSFLRTAYYAARQRGMHLQSWQELARLPQWRGASLAIVGNAGYLADLRQGSMIDGHDLVLRMNNFQTAGLEAQVGSRVDIFLSSFFDDIDFSHPALPKVPLVIASIPNNFHKGNGLKSRHGENITAGLMKLGRRDAYAPDGEFFQSKLAQIGQYPTTGAMALFLACEYLLGICGQVFVTGFSFFEGRTHYFSRRQIVPVNHNADREREVLRELLRPHLASGRIRLDPVMSEALSRRRAA